MKDWGKKTWKDTYQLVLSDKPRHRDNLAISSYPQTKVFAHPDTKTFGGAVFMLQVSDSTDVDAMLILKQARLCGGRWHSVEVVNIKMPSAVTRRMDYKCGNGNEEDTLVTSSPAILFNEHYKSSKLLLTVMNRVHAYDLTEHLKHNAFTSCGCVNQKQEGGCDVSSLSKAIVKGEVVASLYGRSNLDFASTMSTTQV